MKNRLSILILCLFGILIHQLNYGQNPVVALQEYGYRSGLNGPKIVIYDNQSIIYLSEKEYYSTTLSNDDFKYLLSEIDTQYLNSYVEDYQSIFTDPIQTIVTFRYNNILRSFRILGPIYYLIKPEDESLKQKIKTIVSLLANYKNSNSKKWIPDFVEVNLWQKNYPGYSNLKFVKWPSSWPDTTNKRSIRLDSKEREFNIYLPKKYWNSYQKIWSENVDSNSIGLFKLHGLTWQPRVRFPFPGEDKLPEYWD